MYLTQKNTLTNDPEKAKIYRSMPNLDQLHHTLSVFKYRDYFIIGKNNQLIKNPIDLESIFKTKKFYLKIDEILDSRLSDYIITDDQKELKRKEVKNIILETPSSDLSRNDYERSILWLVNRFCQNKILLEDIGKDSKITEYLDAFFIHKNKLAEKDLNKYEYPSQIFHVIKPYVSFKQRMPVDPSKVKDKITWAEDKDGVIYIPLTAEASCALGKGTEWCTAKYRPDDKRNMFEEYNNNGPLYIYFDKNTGIRTQVHFNLERISDDIYDEIANESGFENINSSNVDQSEYDDLAFSEGIIQRNMNMKDEDDDDTENSKFESLLGSPIHEIDAIPRNKSWIKTICFGGAKKIFNNGLLNDYKKTAAIEYPEGGLKIHYKNGIIHRDKGPAIEYPAHPTTRFNNNNAYYIDGKLSRKNGPAKYNLRGVEDSDRGFIWYKDGKIHRDKGPAQLYYVPGYRGIASFYNDGKLIKIEYYGDYFGAVDKITGKRHTIEEFERKYKKEYESYTL